MKASYYGDPLFGKEYNTMATITLDSLKVFNHLIEKGIPKEQAEGFIAAIQEINISGAASKEDVVAFKSELKEDIHQLRSALKEEIHDLRVEVKEDIGTVRTEMAQIKANLMKFILVNTIATITLVVGLIKFL